jgi:hypothetical protein
MHLSRALTSPIYSSTSSELSQVFLGSPIITRWTDSTSSRSLSRQKKPRENGPSLKSTANIGIIIATTDLIRAIGTGATDQTKMRRVIGTSALDIPETTMTSAQNEVAMAITNSRIYNDTAM